MSSQRLVVGLTLLLCLFALWKLLHPVHSYRYRLTIEVEKNGQLRSGSSVIELKTTRNFFLSALEMVPDWETAYHGEAVFVDLGEGDHLIALLQGPNSPHETARFPSNVILGNDTARSGLYIGPDVLSTRYPGRLADAKGKSYAVSVEQLPPLIRFREIEDPMTVERVDPADLAASFGPDVVLRSAHLEITRDEVTVGIAGRLPWLARLRPDKSLSGRKGSLFQAGEVLNSKPNHINYYHLLAD